jgi:hypothetical protein
VVVLALSKRGVVGTYHKVSRKLSAAVRRGISVPPQQPRERRYFRSRDSSLLRHGHWQLSQLTENVASEIEWEQLEFSFEQQPNEGGYASKKGKK